MEIVHRIGQNPSEEAILDYKLIGHDLPAGCSSFEIYESDIKWPKISELIAKHRAVDFVSTEFNVDEIESSSYCSLYSIWKYGYPQPSDDFGYQQITYDDTKYCEKCGMGAIQKAPFRFYLREPKWGRRHVMQLNWVHDEFFVPPQIWEDFFKPYGIECREVLHHKSGLKIESVVQLVIPVIDVVMDHANPKFETCKYCGRKKLIGYRRGFLPPLQSPTDQDLFKTKDVFGTGASAHNAVIISKRLGALLRKNKLRGIGFEPLEEIIKKASP